MSRLPIPTLSFMLALVCLAFVASEGVRQYREDAYVRANAGAVVRSAKGDDLVSKVTALRDFVRAHVSGADFPARNRPFFRDSAAETLRTGKGRCGEATRLFINMAAAEGISAHRLYLEGKKPHVVAVVTTDDGKRLIVDSSDRPYIPELEPFERLQAHTEFTSYSTLGWRRLGLLRALPSHEMSLGPLNHLFENPHFILAFLWLLPAATLLGLTAFLKKKLSRDTPRESEPELTVMAGLTGESAEI
jgi:hypothetical protein